MDVRRTIFTALALAALAACGRLDGPDLSTGSVAGRITGASGPGGYVYVLGRPEIAAALAADGSYSLSRVPAGDVRLVVVVPAGATTKAALVPVSVGGGMLQQVDGDAETMPLSGSVVAAAQPVGGAVPSGARFAIEGTNQSQVGPGALLVDLPAGRWTVTTSLAGFKPAAVTVAVSSGDNLVDVPLAVDDSVPAKGCAATACPAGLQCDAGDGQCYACLADGGSTGCSSGDTCDPQTRTCVSATPAHGGFCELAVDKVNCALGVLVPVPSPPSYGYCSKGCASTIDCPSGWICGPLGAGSDCSVAGSCACQVPLTCRDVATVYGSSCSEDSVCDAALAGGICLRAGEQPGFCTAPCSSTQPCLDFGTCQPGPGGLSYCQP